MMPRSRSRAKTRCERVRLALSCTGVCAASGCCVLVVDARDGDHGGGGSRPRGPKCAINRLGRLP
eukprot:4506460-Prymnesium_polylepis.3